MIYFVGRVYIYNRAYMTLKHSLILFRKCKLELDLFFFSPEKCYYFQIFFYRSDIYVTTIFTHIMFNYSNFDLSENHFRTITILYHCQFVPYADRYIMTISYHMQIDTLWPFRAICRSIHYYNFVPYADKYIMTISYHMQNLMQIVHLSLFYIIFK